MSTPVITVFKFSSCDGCQLAFLNLGESLLELSRLIDIRYFAEAGFLADEISADIAFVEGSISTPEELERIRTIREHSKFLVTIGACATSGGLQALRNLDQTEDSWRRAIYAQPEFIQTLPEATPVSAHVKVDLELWGCPVNSKQVVSAVTALLQQVKPIVEKEKLCLECKREGNICVLVTGKAPCMGPVTQTGCGALCPSFGRDCYACYGPAETCNPESLATRLEGFGLSKNKISNKLLFITSAAPAFNRVGKKWRSSGDKHE